MHGTNLTTDWKVGSPIAWRGEWKGKSYVDKGIVLEIEPEELPKYTHWSPMAAARTSLRRRRHRGELLGPILDGAWPILKPIMLTRCQHYRLALRRWVRHLRSEATGVLGRALLTAGQTCVIGEVPDQAPLSIADDDLGPFLPNGFACVALDASDVASGDRPRQRGEVPQRSARRPRRRQAYPIDHTALRGLAQGPRLRLGWTLSTNLRAERCQSGLMERS